jgi:hypothetical protein
VGHTGRARVGPGLCRIWAGPDPSDPARWRRAAGPQSPKGVEIFAPLRARDRHGCFHSGGRHPLGPRAGGRACAAVRAAPTAEGLRGGADGRGGTRRDSEGARSAWTPPWSAPARRLAAGSSSGSAHRDAARPAGRLRTPPGPGLGRRGVSADSESAGLGQLGEHASPDPSGTRTRTRRLSGQGCLSPANPIAAARRGRVLSQRGHLPPPPFSLARAVTGRPSDSRGGGGAGGAILPA